jgi:hypothetical protein
MAGSAYEPIWYQTELPRAASDARRSTLTGVLRIEDGSAEFNSADHVIQFQPILSVEKGRRGSDFMNRWIEVRYGEAASPSVAYLNDGGWRGWRLLLTKSNRRMVAQLSRLAL